ncbi:MAG: SPOR domain-containing protein [Leptospiraceae bacterium]|nr:SPOR domain-containing protein [Leptospiraceae bacterium]
MKRRVFYVVNLDRARILALGIFAVGAFTLAFATGYRFGNTPDRLSENERPAGLSDDPTAFDAPMEERNTGEDPETLSLSSQDVKKDDEPDESASRDDETVSSRELALKAANPEENGDTPAYRKPRNSVTFSDIARNNSSANPSREKSQEKPAPRKESKPSTLSKPQKQVSPSKPAPRAKPAEKPVQTKKKTEVAKKEESKPQKMFTLQLGAFSSRGAANRMAEQIRKEGMEPYVVKSGNLHLVRLGRSKSQQGLSAQEKKLRDARFRPITVTVGQ